MRTFRTSLLFLVAAAPTWAVPSLLVNGSFEQGAFVPDANGAMSLNPGSTAITGWAISVAELAWISNSNSFNNLSASQGNFSLDLTGYHDGVPFSRVSQTIATTPNQLYELTFDLGVQSFYGNTASIQAIAGPATLTFTRSDQSGQMRWFRERLLFTATGTSTVISLEGALPTTGTYIGLDNVAVNPVPEPASLAILGAGLAALARRARKRVL